MGKLLQSLAVLGNIEALQLVFAGYPQRHERQQHEGYAA